MKAPKTNRIVDKKLIEKLKLNKCIVSGQYGVDVHHVKSRKAGGHDIECNLMPLKRQYHNEVHNIGLTKFSKKYPQVKTWLLNNDWELCQITVKWKNYIA